MNHILIKSIFYSAVSLITIMAIYRSYNYSKDNYMAFAVNKDLDAAYDYVQQHVVPGSIVLAADPEVNMRIRNVAPVYVYVPSGYGTFVTTDEILNRYVEMLKFYSIDVNKFLDYQWYDSVRNTYVDSGLLRIDRLMFNGSLQYSDNVSRTNTFVSYYDSYMSESLTYDIDLVWFGPYEKSVGNINIQDLVELNLIYSNDSVQLYQIDNSK